VSEDGRTVLRRPLRGDPRGVHVTWPTAADAEAFAAAVQRSRDLLHPWADPPATAAAARRTLESAQTAALEPFRATHLSFLVRTGVDGDLVGQVNANEIVRGRLQSAYLGYHAFVPYAGTGRMRRGLALVLDVLFGPIGLHRVEANIRPENTPSRRLVERLGFRHEGTSPRYLYLDDAWRDHERYALLIDEWPGADVFGRPAADA
jgi:[ribosomal protein S5]-alanine N-acetyltransferase